MLSKNSSRFCIKYPLLCIRIRNGARPYPITEVTTDAGKYEKKLSPKLSLDFILWQSFAKPHLHATQLEKEMDSKIVEVFQNWSPIFIYQFNQIFKNR